MEMGKEAQDVAEFFGRWFQAKEQINESQYANNPSMMAKMFSGKSVEGHSKLHLIVIKYKQWKKNCVNI